MNFFLFPSPIFVHSSNFLFSASRYYFPRCPHRQRPNDELWQSSQRWVSWWRGKVSSCLIIELFFPSPPHALFWGRLDGSTGKIWEFKVPESLPRWCWDWLHRELQHEREILQLLGVITVSRFFFPPIMNTLKSHNSTSFIEAKHSRAASTFSLNCTSQLSCKHFIVNCSTIHSEAREWSDDDDDDGNDGTLKNSTVNER